MGYRLNCYHFGQRAATKHHEFDRLCSTVGIEHRLIQPRLPQTNRIAERFNRHIAEVLQSHCFQSGDELVTTLIRYDLIYNKRPLHNYGFPNYTGKNSNEGVMPKSW